MRIASLLNTICRQCSLKLSQKGTWPITVELNETHAQQEIRYALKLFASYTDDRTRKSTVLLRIVAAIEIKSNVMDCIYI